MIRTCVVCKKNPPRPKSPRCEDCSPDPMIKTCVICKNEFRAINTTQKTCSEEHSRILNKQRQQKWDVANRDPKANREKNKRWRDKNPERAKELRKQWDTSEKGKENAKRWKKENPEKVKLSNKRWVENNPDKTAEYFTSSRRKRRFKRQIIESLEQLQQLARKP